jgi:hypothetical protein
MGNRIERPPKWMREADLVVSIGADQQQLPHLRVGDQVLAEVERCSIQPLQIKKARAGAPRARIRKKAPKYHQVAPSSDIFGEYGREISSKFWHENWTVKNRLLKQLERIDEGCRLACFRKLGGSIAFAARRINHKTLWQTSVSSVWE